jgi:hypothetical protein
MTRISRRRFLRTSLGGAAVLTAGGAIFGRWRPRTDTPSAVLKVLTGREARTLSAVAETMLPPREGFPSLEEVDLIPRIDASMAKLHPDDLSDLKALLGLLEYGAPLVGPTRGFFSALPPAERARYLESWEQSRFALKRTGFAAMKYFVMMYYYDHPRAWGGTGFGHLVLPDRVLPDEAAFLAEQGR